MASLAEILGGAGAFSGGLAQGIQSGIELGQRQQQIQMQKRQANLQSLQTFSQIMEPGVDPAVRELALKDLIPQLGLTPEDAKNFSSLATKMDDQSREYFTNFLKNNPEIASGGTPPDTLVQQFMKNPIEGMKYIHDWNIDQKNQEREDVQTQLQVESGQRQEKGLKLEEARVGLEGRRVRNEEVSAAASAARQEREDQLKGIDALSNAVKIEDPNTRAIVVGKINDTYGLNLTQDEMTNLQNRPESLDDVIKRIDVEIKQKQLDISQGNLDVSKQRLQLDKDAATAAVAQKAIENRQQGAIALTNAAKVKDPNLRNTLVEQIDKQYNLGMTVEEKTAFSVSSESLDDILNRLKIEEKTIDIANKGAGFGKSRSELQILLQQRSKGQSTDTMPKFIQQMSPALAGQMADQFSKPGVSVQFGPNTPETKGARDKYRQTIDDIDTTKSLNNRLIGVIEKDPSIASVMGMAARIGQRVNGVATALDPITTDSMKDIGYYLADSAPEVKSSVAKILANRNVSISEVLETALRLRLARVLSDSGRILQKNYEDTADMVAVTGFVGSPTNVLQRLHTVNDVLDTLREGKAKALKEVGSGTGGLDTATPEDMQNDSDYQDFLKENGLDGSSGSSEDEEEQ